MFCFLISYKHEINKENIWVKWLNFPDNCNTSDWVYKDGIFVLKFISSEQNKSKAKQLIAESDWSVLEDVNITANCKSEYKIYRTYLRDIIIKCPNIGKYIEKVEADFESEFVASLNDEERVRYILVKENPELEGLV